MHFVTHLESALDQTRFAANTIHTLHKDRPLWVRYDLDAIGAAVSPGTLSGRRPDLWRYHELLPAAPAEAVSLGEGMTPLLRAERLGRDIGLNALWIKDESQLPTGSFKSRGMAMAVTMAHKFGIRRVAAPTAGNAGGALAAYGAAAGMDVYLFMPRDTPTAIQAECVGYGARVFLVDGLITDCGRLVRSGIDSAGWFDMATLKEPYRIEGKKTMGLELAEQFDWHLPDVIVYPTGGGTGLIGMWKAFQELHTLGWLKNDAFPRMIAVQSTGCAPIVRAFDAGERFATPWSPATTTSWGIRVPAAVGDFMILDAIRESRGRAVAVPEVELHDWAHRSSAAEGISMCSESGACVAAARQLVADGVIGQDERVVVFNTGSALKYHDGTVPELPVWAADAEPDYARLVETD